jgi:hypothetical protein
MLGHLLALFEAGAAIGGINTFEVHVPASLARVLAIALDLASLALVAGDGCVARTLRALLGAVIVTGILALVWREAFASVSVF